MRYRPALAILLSVLMALPLWACGGASSVSEEPGPAAEAPAKARTAASAKETEEAEEESRTTAAEPMEETAEEIQAIVPETELAGEVPERSLPKEPFDAAEDPWESSFWEISDYTPAQVLCAARNASYTDTYVARDTELVSISEEGILEILLEDNTGYYPLDEYDRFYIDGLHGWTGTDDYGNTVDLSKDLESVYCDPDALALATAAAELIRTADPGLAKTELKVSEKVLTGQDLSNYTYACLFLVDWGVNLYTRYMDDEDYIRVSEEEAEDLVLSTLGFWPEKGIEDLEHALISDEGGYNLVPAGFEDVRYQMRLIGEIPEKEERVLLGELRSVGNITCVPCGIYEIHLKEDDDSIFGAHLDRLVRRTQEPVFETLTAGTELKGYPVGNVLDGYRSTCWCEGEEGLGFGTEIRFKASSPQKIHGIRIGAGYLKNRDVYEKNARPNGYEIILSDGTLIIAQAKTGMAQPGPYPEYMEEDSLILDSLEGDDSWDHLYTDFISIGREIETDSLTIRLVSIEEGTRYEDTCISEIRIY